MNTRAVPKNNVLWLELSVRTLRKLERLQIKTIQKLARTDPRLLKDSGFTLNEIKAVSFAITEWLRSAR